MIITRIKEKQIEGMDLEQEAEIEPYFNWSSFLFKRQSELCPWARISNDSLAQVCFLIMASLMFEEFDFTTYANAETIAGRIDYVRKPRVREKLIKLQELGFIYQQGRCYKLSKKLRIYKKQKSSSNQSYYSTTKSVLSWLLTQSKTNRGVFGYLATLKGSIREGQEENVYSIVDCGKNTKPWEILGMTRKGWYVSLNDLEEQGKIELIRMGRKIISIHILTGREIAPIQNRVKVKKKPIRARKSQHQEDIEKRAKRREEVIQERIVSDGRATDILGGLSRKFSTDKHERNQYIRTVVKLGTNCSKTRHEL